MKNLAGVKDCDVYIINELNEAGITILSVNQIKGEVPYTVIGILGNFTFRRAWYYWMVDGDVPLEIAKEIYVSSVGKKDIRVAGNCGCPPPEEWAFPKPEVLIKLGICKPPSNEHPFGDGPTCEELAKMCNNGIITAPRFVDTYHIDSQNGLNLFVNTIKKYDLIQKEDKFIVTNSQLIQLLSYLDDIETFKNISLIKKIKHQIVEENFYFSDIKLYQPIWDSVTKLVVSVDEIHDLEKLPIYLKHNDDFIGTCDRNGHDKNGYHRYYILRKIKS